MIIITATGHLGADAVVRETNGRKFISFRICSTVKRGNTEASTWISVIYRYGENLLPYLVKGAAVLVSGEGDAKLYNGKNGASIDMNIFANTLQLIGGKSEPRAEQPPKITSTQIFDNDKDNDDNVEPF